VPPRAAGGQSPRERLKQLAEATERRFDGTRAWRAYAARVERADMRLRPAEILYATLFGAVVLALVLVPVVGAAAVLLVPLAAAALVWLLLGVRAERRDELVEQGHRLRVYVPFGEHWYRYSLRRLQENPAMAGTIARATAGRMLGLGSR
jgi:hypothetical protein